MLICWIKLHELWIKNISSHFKACHLSNSSLYNNDNTTYTLIIHSFNQSDAVHCNAGSLQCRRGCFQLVYGLPHIVYTSYYKAIQAKPHHPYCLWQGLWTVQIMVCCYEVLIISPVNQLTSSHILNLCTIGISMQ